MFCPACAAISRVVAWSPNSPNCAIAAAINWFFACSPRLVVGAVIVFIIGLKKLINRLIKIMTLWRGCPYPPAVLPMFPDTGIYAEWMKSWYTPALYGTVVVSFGPASLACSSLGTTPLPTGRVSEELLCLFQRGYHEVQD